MRVTRIAPVNSMPSRRSQPFTALVWTEDENEILEAREREQVCRRCGEKLTDRLCSKCLKNRHVDVLV